MKPIVVSARNLRKTFRAFNDRPMTIKAYLMELLRGRIGFGRSLQTTVLEGVSFDIRAGEFVGIMGANGVGKSTLLKILSGIYAPTSGEIRIGGQIAPMIELGAGFHPELTGHENIFLNAAILGYGRKAILSELDAILAFAELGEKVHMPVKHFSSGMLARLGFAVATHLPAPIILIDEIFAVGDIGFQEKCIRKVRSLHAAGKTLILISHDADTIARNCDRCILIADREVRFDGDAQTGAAKYKELFQAK